VLRLIPKSPPTRTCAAVLHDNLLPVGEGAQQQQQAALTHMFVVFFSLQGSTHPHAGAAGFKRLVQLVVQIDNNRGTLFPEYFGLCGAGYMNQVLQRPAAVVVVAADNRAI
jgi:hypothetical protein